MPKTLRQKLLLALIALFLIKESKDEDYEK